MLARTPVDASEAGRDARLAGIIRAYWSQRGYDVTLWTERAVWGEGVRSHDHGPVTGVRSDMVNGMPQRRKQENGE